MKDRLFEAPKSRLDYFKEWLRRLKQAQDQIPIVQDLEERTEWEINTLNDLPEDAQEFFSLSLVDNYDITTEHLRESLPLPPEFNVLAVPSAAALSTSGSSSIYSAVSRAGEVDAEDIQKWSGIHTGLYREIQKKQTRFDKVKQQLQMLNANRVGELETARQEYAAAVSDVGERIAAGIAMRNVLDHFKGDLFERARDHLGENMTWEQMAERLTLGKVGGIEHKELINQEVEWRSLKVRLSDVAKGQKHGLVVDLQDIWTKLVDHLFTVLGIIKL